MPDSETTGRPGRANPRPRPLPDAVAIRPVQVPDVAPPYDDAPGAARRTAAARPPARPAAVPRADARQAPVDQAPVDQAPGRQAPGRQAPAGRDGAGAWPGQFAQVLAETLAGARPPEQIAAWTTEQARRRISALGPLLAGPHRPRVRRVIVSSPAGDVLELTAIVGLGSRVRALAIRMERAAPAAPRGTPGERRPEPPRWLCTAVEAA